VKLGGYDSLDMWPGWERKEIHTGLWWEKSVWISLLGRQIRKWKYNIERNLRDVRCEIGLWIELARDRVQ